MADQQLEAMRSAYENLRAQERHRDAEEVSRAIENYIRHQTASSTKGAERSVLSGATFGFAPTIESKLTGQSESDIRREQELYRQQNPVISTLLEMGGAVPTGMGTGAALMRFGGAAGRALTAPTMAGGAALGTLEGAAYGAGMAPPGERLRGAAIGGGLGAIGGAISGPISGAITRRLVPGMTAERMAANELASDLGYARQTTPSPTDYAELAARAEAQPQRTLAEISGPSAEMQAVTVHSMGGPAANIIEEAIEPRRATSSQRLIESLGENIGTRESYRSAYNRLTEQASTEAGPLYRAAYEADFVPDDELVALGSTPKRQKLLRQGYERARESAEIREGEVLPEWKDAIEGGFEDLDLKAWDYIKRGLDAQYQSVASKDPSRASDILALKRQLVSKLDELGPEEYQQARAAWAGPKAQEDALEAGKTVLREDAQTSTEMVAEMSQAEREAYAVGAAQVIRNRLLNVPPEGGMPRFTPLLKERMQAAFPDPDDFDAFWSTITSERDMQRFRNLFKGQSITGRLQAGQERQQRLLGAGRGIAEILTGQRIEGARTIAGNLAPRRQTLPENVTQPLARILSAKGAEVRPVLQRMQQPPIRPRLLGPVTTTEAALLLNRLGSGLTSE